MRSLRAITISEDHKYFRQLPTADYSDKDFHKHNQHITKSVVKIVITQYQLNVTVIIYRY